MVQFNFKKSLVRHPKTPKGELNPDSGKDAPVIVKFKKEIGGKSYNGSCRLDTTKKNPKLKDCHVTKTDSEGKEVVLSDEKTKKLEEILNS